MPIGASLVDANVILIGQAMLVVYTMVDVTEDV